MRAICPTSGQITNERTPGGGFPCLGSHGGLIIDVSVNVHVDIHANGVGLFFHDVAQKTGATGQQSHAAHDPQGQAQICQNRPADARAVQGQVLAQDI